MSVKFCFVSNCLIKTNILCIALFRLHFMWRKYKLNQSKEISNLSKILGLIKIMVYQVIELYIVCDRKKVCIPSISYSIHQSFTIHMVFQHPQSYADCHTYFFITN